MAVAIDRRAAYADRQPERPAGAVDLLRLPLVGRLLRLRGLRLALQLPLFALAVVLVLHGLFGPDLAPKNLATLVTWVHYRGLLVLVLLVAGNFFCFACPFLVSRELARRLFRPVWNWPRPLRNKWLAAGLFVLMLFVYEWFGLWGTPWWTAWLIVGFFAAALAVDALFKHDSFCKWVCPIGQFNFVASTMSPLEVQVRDPEVCAGCRTKDCIRGTAPATPSGGRQPPERGGRRSLPVLSQRGCELALFQPMKVGNLDCTFCLDCVHACPHDNIGLVSRLPGAELWQDTSRSGVGRPHRRKDLAALAVVFTFAALLNAFGMVSPVYAVQTWLSRTLGTTDRAPILAVLFLAGLVVEPVLLLGLAAWGTRRLTGSRQVATATSSREGEAPAEPCEAPRLGRSLALPTRRDTPLQSGLLTVATRYAFSLVPLGFGVWLAHYAFHFLTGFLTIVPVTQNALAELGLPLLGEPVWSLGGMRPGAVYVLEWGLLGLGLVGSGIVAVRLGREDHPPAPWRAYLPWLVLHALLWGSAVWLLSQPMEMRGTFLEG
jgi:polyferredoxin